MLKVWYTTSNKKKNNNLVILIKSGFSDLKKETENTSEEGKEIEKPNEIIDIVEKILEFKDQTQRGQGLKILRPDQMLSWWPINLAQLKAEIILKNLKIKSENYCTLCTVQKNWPIQSITIWLTLFKNGNKSLWTPKIVRLINLTDLDYH